MKKSLLVMTLVAVVLPQNGFGKNYKSSSQPAESVDNALLAQAGSTPLITAILSGKNSVAINIINVANKKLLNKRTKSGVSAFSFALYKGNFEVANLLLDKGVQVSVIDMNWIIKNFNFNPTTNSRIYFSNFVWILKRLYKADFANIKYYLEGKTPVSQWNDWMMHVDDDYQKTRGKRIMEDDVFHGDFH